MLARQLAAFGGVGALAFVAHYGTLLLAVEMGRAGPVAGALLGYHAGGLVSYLLNHRYTFASETEHQIAAPRFVVVAATGFVLTGGLMAVLTGPLTWHYLRAQLVTTLIVMFWSFFANRAWTFAAARS